MTLPVLGALSTDTELVLLGVLVAVAALFVVSAVSDVPYPILFVLRGLTVGFVPGGPNVRQISLLSIGLVLATTFAVAAIAHAWIDDLSWSAAIVLGAVVSPTDPIAATSIFQRLSVPRWVVAQVRQRLDDAPAEISLSLLTAYFAYLPAVALGVSGVLAVVTTGIFLGWRAPRLVTSPATRLQAYATWEILVFVVNAFLFVLLGLQFQDLVQRLNGFSAGTLVGYGALVSAAVIVVRFAWVVPFTYLSRGLVHRFREGDDDWEWKAPILIAWTGMRGAVSLAAALAIPFTTDAGAPFPARDLMIFLTFCVILGTLVLQGLTLPAVIRALGVEDDGLDAKEDAKARIRAAEAALERLDELV